MALFEIKNLTFSYPTTETPALKDITLSIEKGSFMHICGESACGKTTLLKHLKPELIPNGIRSGEVRYMDENVQELKKEQSMRIGYVFQNADNQIVFQRSVDELTFAQDNAGYSNEEKNLKIAEMSSILNLQEILSKDTSSLSGGEKQVLCLASVLISDPQVLILDEPLSRLDPISSSEFLALLKRLNEQFGTTIIVSDMRCEEIFSFSSHIVFMHKGEIIYSKSTKSLFEGADAFKPDSLVVGSLPSPTRLFLGFKTAAALPITVKDAIFTLKKLTSENNIFLTGTEEKTCEKCAGGITGTPKTLAVELKKVFFRYEKNAPDILSGLDLELYSGEVLCVLGSNGAGKTTLLSAIGGLRKPYSGAIKVFGRKLSEYKNGSLYDEMLSAVPQNPYLIFTRDNVLDDLMLMTKEQCEIERVVKLLKIENILLRHPYDLSGGEAQKAALAKALLTKPKILMLDEPTKGLDYNYKEHLGYVLRELKNQGVAIICATHDLDFSARYADRCAMFYDGKLSGRKTPKDFFNSFTFHTTPANIIARSVGKDYITIDEFKINER